MIPKIIHYCWLSDDPYPEELKRCMETWAKKLPDYEFKIWNFKNFDKKSSNWVTQAFDNKKYAFAADYIRLYAIYNYGGIYMDMDIEVLKSFNDLLNLELMIAYENEEKNGIEAGCFGAEKNNPLIKECLDYYTNRNFIKDDGSFDIIPLPKIMMKFFQNHDEVKIKDCYTFTCKSYQTGKITKKDYSYAIHNFAGSWTTDSQKHYDKIRKSLYNKYGSKWGKILSLPSLISWQLKDNGIKSTIKKILTRKKIKY